MHQKEYKASRDIIRRMNDENTPTPKKERMISFKRDQFYTVMVIVAFAAGILAGYFIWGANPPASAVVAAPPQGQVAAVENQAPSTRYEIPTEGYFSVGPEDAEITLIEFSDFGCSFCAKWHNETYDDLMAAYPGKIRFVYRNVPFRAFPAAEASMCASEQDAYWPYHDKLFSYEYGLTDDAYVQYAEDLNLNMDTFNTCISEHRYQEFIQNDMDYATQLGIQSTPTFFINGLALIGAQPIGAFKQVIDQELASGS